MKEQIKMNKENNFLKWKKIQKNVNQTLARKSVHFLLNSFKKLLNFDGGKALAFRAAPRWKKLFLRRVEGRAAEVVRNYLYTGSKVEPAGCGELFSCRVEGRAPEPENYRSTLLFIKESNCFYV